MLQCEFIEIDNESKTNMSGYFKTLFDVYRVRPEPGFRFTPEFHFRLYFIKMGASPPTRVSICVTWFLKQFEAERIEAMQIGNLLIKIEDGSSSLLAVPAL